MPIIAEVREIEGQCWVRIDVPRMPTGIGIYDPDEIAHLEELASRDALEIAETLCIAEANDSRNGNSPNYRLGLHAAAGIIRSLIEKK